MDDFLRKNLVCPRDFQKLTDEGDALRCPQGHAYPVADGIPIMLVREAAPTLFEYEQILAQIRDHSQGRYPLGSTAPENTRVDPFVAKSIVGTCGLMYRSLEGKLKRYPIPEIRLPSVKGELLLDIGCSWGRWSISAARKGYEPVGIDPSLEAILAARRVAKEMGITAHFLVADSRFLPFPAGIFRNVFSYSVFQHFEEPDVSLSLIEISRVMDPAGHSLIQMANTFGPTCILLQIRRGFRKPKNFEVHYWTPFELRREFSLILGSSRITVDGFFSLNPQKSDIDLLPFQYKFSVMVSEVLRWISERIPGLLFLADSLYLESSPGAARPGELNYS
jgi:2-polyprenyl-3-methyl-5-hydroxy-6-metoxy-1,4-benzoquinol methylase/uncharacterized protein YbaR (Trm112 family)